MPVPLLLLQVQFPALQALVHVGHNDHIHIGVDAVGDGLSAENHLQPSFGGQQFPLNHGAELKSQPAVVVGHALGVGQTFLPVHQPFQVLVQQAGFVQYVLEAPLSVGGHGIQQGRVVPAQPFAQFPGHLTDHLAVVDENQDLVPHPQMPHTEILDEIVPASGFPDTAHRHWLPIKIMELRLFGSCRGLV